MKQLTIIFFAVLCVACNSEKMGDHKVLLNATQSQWLEGSLANRKATANFYAWVLLGKPEARTDKLSKLGEGIRACIDELEADTAPSVDQSAVVCKVLIEANSTQ